MATIKKNDFHKAKIDELIDTDGSPIEGDEKYDTTSQINVGTDKAGSGMAVLTGDKFGKMTRQGRRFYYAAAGTQGGPLPGNSSAPTPFNDDLHEDEENDSENKERCVEESKDKMTKLVEDMLANKTETNDMVKNTSKPDVNRNNVPDIDELRRIKPIIANSSVTFVKTLQSQPLKGDEKAIMINFILSNIDLSDISPDYKNILKSKI